MAARELAFGAIRTWRYRMVRGSRCRRRRHSQERAAVDDGGGLAVAGRDLRRLNANEHMMKLWMTLSSGLLAGFGLLSAQPTTSWRDPSPHLTRLVTVDS